MKKFFHCLALVFTTIPLITAGCGAPANVNTNSSANTVPPDANNSKIATVCNDKTIETALAKAYSDPRYRNDLANFNYFSKGCEVTLFGWMHDSSTRQWAILDAENIKGVVKVNDSGLKGDQYNIIRPSASCGCPTDYKACGDICIPQNETCNHDDGKCPRTLAPTPTP